MGLRLISEMENYNHVVGLKIVGEMLPQEATASRLPTMSTSTACAFPASPIHGAITISA